MVFIIYCFFQTVTEPFTSIAMFVTNTNDSITVNHTNVPGATGYNVRAVNGLGKSLSICNQ